MDKNKLIAKPPQTFIQEVAGNRDLKELESYHGLLHQWAAEIRSNSDVTEIGEYRWNLQQIVVAHEATLRRMRQLRPSINHESPIMAATFAPKPVMLKRNAMRVLDGNYERVIMDLDSDMLPPGSESRVAAAMGSIRGEAGVGPGTEPYCYHLMLVPEPALALWGTSRVAAAMAQFKAINSIATSRSRLTSATAIGRMIRRAASAMTTEEAVAIGGEAAMEAIGAAAAEQPLPDHPYASAMANEAYTMIARLLDPIYDPSILVKARNRVVERLHQIKGEPPSRASAMIAARQVAVLVGKEMATLNREEM